MLPKCERKRAVNKQMGECFRSAAMATLEGGEELLEMVGNHDGAVKNQPSQVTHFFIRDFAVITQNVIPIRLSLPSRSPMVDTFGSRG